MNLFYSRQRSRILMAVGISFFSVLFVPLLSLQNAAARPIDQPYINDTSSNAKSSDSAVAQTIKSKCNTTISRIQDKHSKDADFKVFQQACNGTGIYKANAAKAPQQAKRLLDICTVYGDYLREANEYLHDGKIDSGSCDKIASDTALQTQADKAADYPAGSLGTTHDPALACGSLKDTRCDLMTKYVNPIISFLAIFVGIAVTIGIISGGVRYAAAGDDPQKVSAAKAQIRGAIIALVAFIFLYAAIQWMIPQTS